MIKKLQIRKLLPTTANAMLILENFKMPPYFYTIEKEINNSDLENWLKKSREIQWDYKNIVKRKGILERLK